MIDVLIGTNNPGKFSDAQRVATDYPELRLHQPADLDISEDIDETGGTYTRNAHIKRDFYVSRLIQLGLKDYFVICDDSGLEIDALDGEPGIHSRRWKDSKTPMTDQEIVGYTLERLQDIPAGKRTAAFAGIVALGHPSRNLTLDIPYRLEGTLLEEPDDSEWEAGYPFRALFYLPQYGMMLSKISRMPPEERPEGFRTHRELGMKAAFEKIMELS